MSVHSPEIANLGLPPIDQVGFVVHDLDAAIARYSPLFGPFHRIDGSVQGCAKGVRRKIDADIQVDPIVSIEVWERANTLLGTREVKQPVNLFAGRVSCSCGGVMTVPSNSTKYVCPRCPIKIPSDDLESVFLSQLEPFRIGSHTLSESWATFNLKNKRLIVEHLCEAVTVARESISIRFACDPSLLKTAALGQPMQPGLDGHLEQPPSNIPQEPLNEPLLSEAEAAIFLGISKSTLLRERNAGLIGFFQVNSARWTRR